MAAGPLADLTVNALLDRLAAGDPTPGGGAASALAGALGAALVSMVCNLTVGRERYAEHDAEVRAIRDEALGLLARLRDGVQEDADAYGGVMAALRLPRQSDAEKAARSEAVQAATLEAARVPLELAEASARVLDLAERAVGKTNPNAASDLAVAALLAGAALDGAAANVEVNLTSLTDDPTRAQLGARLATVRAGRQEQAGRIAGRLHA